MAKTRKPSPAMAKRPDVDWEAVESEYRANSKSVRAIAAKYGVTDTAIRKRAKAGGWERELAEKVRKKVREKLVRGLQIPQDDNEPAPRMSDEEVIETQAQAGAALITTHRKDIHSLRDIAASMAAELIDMREHLGEIDADIDAAIEDRSRRARMKRAVSLYGRSGVLTNLAQVMSKLIPLERQAFNLDEVKMGADPHEDWLSRMEAMGE